MSSYKEYILYISESPFGSFYLTWETYESLDKAIEHIETYRLTSGDEPSRSWTVWFAPSVSPRKREWNEREVLWNIIINSMYIRYKRWKWILEFTTSVIFLCLKRFWRIVIMTLFAKLARLSRIVVKRHLCELHRTVNNGSVGVIADWIGVWIWMLTLIEI